VPEFFAVVGQGLMAELHAVPVLLAILHHGVGATGHMLDEFSIGNEPPHATNVVKLIYITTKVEGTIKLNRLSISLNAFPFPQEML